jgi:hypothetical protein
LTVSPGITISVVFWQFYLTSHVSRADVELWLVALEERCMATTFFLGEDVDLTIEFGVWSDAEPGLAKT